MVESSLNDATNSTTTATGSNFFTDLNTVIDTSLGIATTGTSTSTGTATGTSTNTARPSTLNPKNIIGSGSLKELTDGEFDYQFETYKIPAGESIIIQYGLTTNAVSVGKFHVGLLESDDAYGDVSMNANAICGDQEILWKTIPPVPRTYTRTLKEIVKGGDTAGSQKGKFTDFNNNGSPDYIDLLSGQGTNDVIESSLWDPAQFGVLVFREISGPNGLDGTNFEVGRVVANAESGYVQLNPVSGTNDIPVLSTPALNQSIRNGNTITTGSVGDPSMTTCGGSGTITSDLKLV